MTTDERLLVIGGRGNLGRALVPALRKAGYRVHVWDTHPGEGVSYTPVDITAPLDVYRQMELGLHTTVINLAATCGRVVAEAIPERALAVNVAGALTVAQACRRVGARLIHLSTSEIYATGHRGAQNWYGVTKLWGEEAVRYTMPEAAILRPFMLVAEGETRGQHRSAMIRFAEAVWEGREIEVHEGSSRSWMHYEDAVAVLQRLVATTDWPERPFDIGNPQLPTTMLTLVGMFERVMGKQAALREVPMPPGITQIKLPELSTQAALMPPDWTPLPLDEIVRRVARRFTEAA